MPTNKSQNGKTFAELASEISNKYSDRYDAISQKTLKKEMGALKDAQEIARAKKQAEDFSQANLGKILAYGGPTSNNPELLKRAKDVLSSLNGTSKFSLKGITPEVLSQLDGMSDDKIKNLLRSIPLQPNMDPGMSNKIKQGFPELFSDDTSSDRSLSDFLRDAKASVPINPTERSQAQIQSKLAEAPVGDMQIPMKEGKDKLNVNLDFDPTDLRYAPVLTNALNLFGNKPEVQQAPVNRASAQQSRFDRVDTSALERAITERGRAFTETNRGVSGGNAAGFLSNELASQLNQLRATGDARLQAEAQNRETDQLNAAEQARVDSFNANIQSENNRMKFATDDINARNRAASENLKRMSLAQIGTDLGNIGREAYNRNQVASGTGYGTRPDGTTYKIGGDDDPNKIKAYGGYLMSKIKKKKNNG